MYKWTLCKSEIAPNSCIVIFSSISLSIIQVISLTMKENDFFSLSLGLSLSLGSVLKMVLHTMQPKTCKRGHKNDVAT